MSKTKTTKKAAAPKATKSAKASKPAPAKKAKGVQQTGDAPQSQLDLEETKKLEATRAKKAKAPATNGETKTKKVSAIDAAAKLLAGSKEPMGCKEMIETLAAKGIWTSPGGKTPHATLYSAILREINEKGKDARFVKTERGRFAAKSAS
jgi:hypothetical protein